MSDITTESMRTAFASYAEIDEASSIRRCWSTWNVLSTYLSTSELVSANPMPQIGRPKVAKTLPKALPAGSVAALLGALQTDTEQRRRRDWVERDRAIILTALLAGLRSDELICANGGDVRGPTTAPSSTCAATVEKTGGFRSRRRSLRSWTATSKPRT